MTRQKQRIMAITLIGVLLCIVSLLALHVGTIMIPIGGGVQSILNGMGIPVSFTEPISAEQEAVLWFIRMPRLIIGLLVGGALAIAGAVMQGVFSNPLADPGIMGVSAGASLGAVIAIALGVTSLGMFYMPAFAFVGAFVSVGITILLTWRNNKLDTTTLLLAGVAVSMLLGAFTSGILTMINEYRLHAIPVFGICRYCYCGVRQWFHWFCRSCGTTYCAYLSRARSSNTIAYGGRWRRIIPRIL